MLWLLQLYYGFPSMLLTTKWKDGRGRDIKIFISKRWDLPCTARKYRYFLADFFR